MGEEVISDAWWVPMLGTIAAVIGSVVVYLFRKLINKAIAKMDLDEAEKEAVQAVLAGMAKAQNEIVHEAKIAAADGKLTKVERENAQRLAVDHAKEIAKGPAKDLLMSWGKDRLDSLIKQLLAKFKKSKSNGDVIPSAGDTPDA